MCFYCKQQKLKNMQEFVFRTINELFDHWKQKHCLTAKASPENNSTSKSDEYRFYSVDLLQCQVGNCKFTSAFRGLRNHHQSEHKDVPFVVVFNGRCAFCFTTNEHMNEHRCDEFHHLDMFNPIRYTNEELAELQTVLERQKFQCLICKRMFEMQQDMTQHHHQQHP